MNIFCVPIEPLEERYTASWYRNVPAFFREQGALVTMIDGHALTETVETGTFLDIHSTVHYKASQVAEIARLFKTGEVRNGDCFFFFDLEFWGVEAVRVLAQLSGLTVGLFGFLHAASYFRDDIMTVAAPYQQYTEVGWVRAMDKVFVGSEYHKAILLERRPSVDRTKIVVTGNPMFVSDYPLFVGIVKKNQIAMTARFDWEKRPHVGLALLYTLKRRRPDIEIVIATSRPSFRSNRRWLYDYAQQLAADGIVTIKAGLTKTEYHHLLAESKVMLSTTIEETFNYCVAEAAWYDCCPVVERAFSHPEIIHDDRLMFTAHDQVLSIVEAIIDGRLVIRTRPFVERFMTEPMQAIWHEIHVFTGKNKA